MDRPLVVPPGSRIAMSAEGVRTARRGVAPDNYAFVMNVSRLVDATSFSLAPGHNLRPASDKEISGIKEVLQRHMSEPRILPWEDPQLSGESLPEAEWRYFVISFQGPNSTLVEIEEVLNIAPLELKIAFTVVTYVFGGGACSGLIMHTGRLFHLLQSARWGDLAFLDVTASDVEQIGLIRSQLQQHDHRLVDVKRLVRQIQDLEGLPPASQLQFLGYFGVLESLLTHPPKQTDPYDSITRQVKKKIALLNHRCQPRIDYSPFATSDAEKLWTTMYRYRSLLAHGGAPTFDRELRILQNHYQAHELLKQTVKAVIRQALIEPQLLADLRDC